MSLIISSIPENNLFLNRNFLYKFSFLKHSSCIKDIWKKSRSSKKILPPFFLQQGCFQKKDPLLPIFLTSPNFYLDFFRWEFKGKFQKTPEKNLSWIIDSEILHQHDFQMTPYVQLFLTLLTLLSTIVVRFFNS